MNSLTLRHPLWIAFVVLVAASLAIVGLAGAQQSSEGSEPGVVQTTSVQAPAYDSATSTGLPPDDNPPAGSSAEPRAVATTFSYYQVAGTTLQPRDGATSYDYDLVGCTHVTAGSDRTLNTELHIPEGSVIKYLRIYYNDTNAASGLTAYLVGYDPGQSTSELVFVSSPAGFDDGFGFVVSQEISHTVDNTTNAYALLAQPGIANSTVQICGLRVAYYAPLGLSSNFVPIVQR